MKASEDQVSGNHYKKYAIQPAEFIQKNGLNWCEGNAIKYLVRHRDKKGAEDLRKAKHYIDLLLEWEYSAPLPDGEGTVTTDKAEYKKWLCQTCDLVCSTVFIQACEKTGVCAKYTPNLRERVLNAKQSKPSLCHSCHIPKCDKPLIERCEMEGVCAQYVPEAKQEVPTAAEQPLDFTLPSIALKCTAEEAKEKYESEWNEWLDSEDGSFEELVERWDCLQALQTFYERGGNVDWWQPTVRGVMKDLTDCSEGRNVMGAKADMLIKNARRGYYRPEVNAEILASYGHSFTP